MLTLGMNIPTQAPHLLARINLTPAWISNYIHYNVWDEIAYPFPNFNDYAVEVYKWVSIFILHYWLCLLIHAGIKVNPC